VSFPSLGFDELHSAGADLQVQAAAAVFYEVVVVRSAGAVTSRVETATATEVFLLEFGLNSVDVAAVAFGLEQAVAEGLSWLLNLCNAHRLELQRAAGGREARHDRLQSISLTIHGDAAPGGQARWARELVIGDSGEREGADGRRCTGAELIHCCHALQHDRYDKE